MSLMSPRDPLLVKTQSPASVRRSGVETMRFDPKRILLSKRLTHVTTDPFCFFYVDDYRNRRSLFSYFNSFRDIPP